MPHTPPHPAANRPGSARASQLAALFAIALLAGCGSSDSGPEVAPPLPLAPGAWTQLTPAAVEIDGQLLTPTCSKAPGSKSAFHFWAKRGTADKLVVFFEGGGACWDSGTCSFPITASTAPGVPALYKAEILASDNPTTMSGIFKLDDPRNPLKDWSFVYVPYCTGDIHSGSKTASYTSVTTGQPYTIEHRGADNFKVIAKWIGDNFNLPEQVLVTGTSAGAYGAMTHYPRIRTMFPKAQAAVLGDAGQGVTPASFDALRNSNWNFQLDARVYGATPQATASSEIVRKLAAFYPADRIGQYTTANDLTQMQFYDVQVNGLTGTQGTACKAWTDGMLAGLAANQPAANYRSYLAAGTTHTLLRGTSPDAAGVPLFFRESSGGSAFTDWLAAMVSPSGAGWDNKACTNCTTLPIACPF